MLYLHELIMRHATAAQRRRGADPALWKIAAYHQANAVQIIVRFESRLGRLLSTR
jgi:hypothetical protein